MTIEHFNQLASSEAEQALARCCGAQKWVHWMMEARPFSSMEEIQTKAKLIWYSCEESDWREAFTHHPKIGDLKQLEQKFAATKNWSSKEQGQVQHASKETLLALADLNQQYADRFGFIFIVCATGKSADEMLELLRNRIDHEANEELQIAMEEQHKITQIRLKKLFS